MSCNPPALPMTGLPQCGLRCKFSTYFQFGKEKDKKCEKGVSNDLENLVER